MLKENIKKYVELKAQAEAIKIKMELLKESIIFEMGDKKEFETDEGIIAKTSEKVTFKYMDEPAMINYLKNNGLGSYIIEKIDTTPMNKELKKGLYLTESLYPWYTKSVSTTLTVEHK